VYYKSVDNGFPSSSAETIGNIIGIFYHFCHALSYKVINQTDLKVVLCSLLRPGDSNDLNRRAVLLGGDCKDIVEYHTDFHKSFSGITHHVTIAHAQVIDPEDLIRHIFELDYHRKGSMSRAGIVRMINNNDH
jgi:hypothetical protein